MHRKIHRIHTYFELVNLAFVDSIKTIFKDSGALLILIFAALFYPIVYSVAYNQQVVRNIPTVIIDNDNTTTSRQWTKMVDATPEIQICSKVTDIHQAEELFWQGEAMAILLIPNDFEKKIFTGQQVTVSLYADASNFLLYKESLKSTLAASGAFSAGVEFKRYLTKTKRTEIAMNKIQPFKTNVYNLYNPIGAYGSFVMPGLMLLIIQQTLLIGIGLVGGAGRERKRNSLDQLSISFAKYPFAAITGKSLAYFFIGVFNIIFITIFVYHWFSFPTKGLFFNVVMLAVPFLLSVVFLGMSISLLFKHREHSIMALVFLSPIVLFVSGLSWPIESIPTCLHHIFKVFPSTFAIPAFIRVRTMGVALSDIKPELIALYTQAFIYFLIAGFSFKIALKRRVV